MARWRLLEAHYIHVKKRGKPVEWEYETTDRITGEIDRERFVVPRYCDIDDIVCYAGSEQNSDNGRLGPLVFEGEPTPAMFPLDDEARTISESLAAKWKHPVDSLPGQGFADNLLASLEKSIAAIASKVPATTPAVVEGVSREEFEALQAQLAALMAEKAEKEATPKTGAPTRAPAPKRRVA